MIFGLVQSRRPLAAAHFYATTFYRQNAAARGLHEVSRSRNSDYCTKRDVAFVGQTYRSRKPSLTASVVSHRGGASRTTAAAEHSVAEEHRRRQYLYDGKEITLIDHFPAALQPYLRLMRVDKPIGTWLLFWPCAWSIGLATPPGCFPDPYMLALFGTGALILRGAGCAINDMWDRDIDAKVERTKKRPIASGQISRLDAFMYLSGLLAMGDLVLLELNTYCVVLGASSLSLVATYPLMKRVTNWPQLFLGIVFNWGALMGWAAVEGNCDFSVCLPLYAACISWTLIYDTIYAHQDKKDDQLAGVKSTALHMGENTKNYLMGFTVTLVSGFVGAGVMSDQTVPYYLAIALATSHIVHQIVTLNTDNVHECGKKFASNYVLGFVIMAGIIASTLLKAKKDTSTNKISGKIEIGKSVTL